MDPTSLRFLIVKELHNKFVELIQRKLQAAEQVLEDMVDLAMHTIAAKAWWDEFFQSTEKTAWRLVRWSSKQQILRYSVIRRQEGGRRRISGPPPESLKTRETWLSSELKEFRSSGTWAPKQDLSAAIEKPIPEPEPELTSDRESATCYTRPDDWATPRASFDRRRSPEEQGNEFYHDNGIPPASP
ncbi:MAG: hypothetical protein Q9208_004631 [Pyrenodesmia sp. 3 TL-2023]